MVKIIIKVDQKWNFIIFFEKFISLEKKFRKVKKNQNLCVWKLNKKSNKMFDWKVSKCLQLLLYVNVRWLVPS